MYFEIYQVDTGLLTGQWRWRLKGANHKVIAHGESYVNKLDCLQTMKSLLNLTPQTDIREV